mmetsp:Transcript_15137/g.48690  ORF Transcript_15137/g.48690 Transcript_15137/m.48690 type:complete len:207 (+) Transcript_15137:857-1477(+)
MVDALEQDWEPGQRLARRVGRLARLHDSGVLQRPDAEGNRLWLGEVGHGAGRRLLLAVCASVHAAVAAAAAPAHVAQVQALRRHAQQVAAPLEGQLAADGHQPLRDAARLDHLAVLLVLRARLLEVRVGRARGRRGCPRRLVRVARRTCTSSRRGARGRPRSVSRVSRADLVAYLVALHLASEHGLQVLGPRAAQAIAQAAVERVA